MDVIDFTDALCHLNTAIEKYLKAKEARKYVSEGCAHLPPEMLTTILDVLGEKIDQYEKQIIELATKLTDRPEEQPDKKKK